MFRNHEQCISVCQTLLNRTIPDDAESFFFNDYPTRLAFASLFGKHWLPWDQLIVIKVMFFFWNQNSAATLSDVVALQPPIRTVIGSLFQAALQSPEAVDEWLNKYQPASHQTGIRHPNPARAFIRNTDSEPQETLSPVEGQSCFSPTSP